MVPVAEVVRPPVDDERAVRDLAGVIAQLGHAADGDGEAEREVADDCVKGGQAAEVSLRGTTGGGERTLGRVGGDVQPMTARMMPTSPIFSLQARCESTVRFPTESRR